MSANTTNTRFLQIIGVVFLLLALGVLIYATLISSRFWDRTDRAMFAIIVALCAGVGVGVLSGEAAIKGQIPGLGPISEPFQIGATGGIATMLIVYLLLHFTFVVSPDPPNWFIYQGRLGDLPRSLERASIDDPRTPRVTITIDEDLARVYLYRDVIGQNPLDVARRLCTHEDLGCTVCTPSAQDIENEVRIELRPGESLIETNEGLTCNQP